MFIKKPTKNQNSSNLSVVEPNFIYLLRLSKKSYYGIFSNFTYNKIKHLEAAKSLILGFSTVSLCT
jgi:hypothetical protein